jgi:signal peptidase I
VAEIAESLAIAMGLVFLIIRPFFVQAFFIPSESMVPTLEIHDHILVNKAVYRLRGPKHGEIVVFHAPPEALEKSRHSDYIEVPQTDYIKRVIGVPGDIIYIEPGYVLVNGERIERGYVIDEIVGRNSQIPIKFKNDGIYVDGEKLSDRELMEQYPGVFPWGSKIEVRPGYVVRNGKKLTEPYVAEDPESLYPNLDDPVMSDDLQRAIEEKDIKLVMVDGRQCVKLGNDQYLMMGDNRNHSSDGRIWGPLDRERVVGRAMFIFWPLDRMQWAR